MGRRSSGGSASTGCRCSWRVASVDPAVGHRDPRAARSSVGATWATAWTAPSASARWCIILLGVVFFACRWWNWQTEEYVITNRRLLKVTGDRQQALRRLQPREDQRRDPRGEPRRPDPGLRRPGHPDRGGRVRRPVPDAQPRQDLQEGDDERQARARVRARRSDPTPPLRAQPSAATFAPPPPSAPAAPPPRHARDRARGQRGGGRPLARAARRAA